MREVISSLTILINCWAGVRLVQHLLTNGPRLDGLDKILNDFKIDIRLQEGNPHLFHGLLDILLRQFSMASELLKNSIQFCG